MASVDTLVNGDVHTIPPLRGRATKTTLHVELNGGAVTIQPRCKAEGASLLDSSDLAEIEYNTAADRATKATADITASGVYEFFHENLDLVLTISGVTGEPRLHWNTANA